MSGAVREVFIKYVVEMDETAVKKTKSGLDDIAKAAIAFGAIFVTGAVAKGYKSLIESASAAKEEVNKFNAVFGEASEETRNLGEAMANDLGRGKGAVRGLITEAGALIKPLLGNAKAAGEMSVGIAQLALDISSFSDMPTEEALRKLKAGLVGSSEPLLSMGIDTRKAALSQFALSKGIKTAVKDMSNAQITALRYELIMKRFGDQGAIGDARNTMDGYANASRRLSEKLDDLAAAIGGKFLASEEKSLKTMIKLVDTITGPLLRGVDFVIDMFRGLGMVIEIVATAWNDLGKSSSRLEFLLYNLGFVLAAVAISFGIVGAEATIAGISAAAAWIAAAAPMILMVALIGAIIASIALVLEDFALWKDGADSVIGTMITGFTGLVEKLGSVPAAIMEMIAVAFPALKGFMDSVKKYAGTTFGSIKDTLIAVWDTVIANWEIALAKFLGSIDKKIPSALRFIMGIPKLTKLAGVSGKEGQEFDLSKLGNVSGMLGGIGSSLGVGGGQGSTSRSASSDIKVSIDASSSGTPSEIGQEVANKVSDVWDNFSKDLLSFSGVSG